MTWTRFYDMHSGGSRKTEWDCIWIELPEHLAIAEFKNRFDLDPKNVTCHCCGEDFSSSEGNPDDGRDDWEKDDNWLLIPIEEIGK